MFMSTKEASKLRILTLLETGKISQKEAGQRMEVTPRQVRRMMKRYKAEGVSGLISRKRGRASNRKLSEESIIEAMDLIRLSYHDFGPTLAAEKLREVHHLNLSVETVRKAMIKAGIWKAKRGNDSVAHPIRERRASFGEMIQIDGSPHDWFEGRGDSCTLLVFIDDATGRLTNLRFVPTETTLGYMQVLHDHIKTYGVPVSLYSDKHAIFRVNAKTADEEAQTQFSRAARDLGIECIHAHSPQAKGRVERVNQTMQDRLIKEMRLEGINNSAEANTWLPAYIKDFNRRFSVNPRSEVDAHSPFIGTDTDLTNILSVHTTRTLSKNLSCQFENKLLQVKTTGTGLALRGSDVTVLEHFDGRCDLMWQKRNLNYSVSQKEKKQAGTTDGKSVNQRVDDALVKRFKKGTANKPKQPISIQLAKSTKLRKAKELKEAEVIHETQRQNLLRETQIQYQLLGIQKTPQNLTPQTHLCVSL